jgi:signal peptidase I
MSRKFSIWNLFSSRPDYSLPKKEGEVKLNMKKQWAKFIVVIVLYLLFLLWLQSWLGLVVVPFIYDVYITKKIKWQWWRERENPTRMIMSWVDAIVFALVAVYFINQFFFQNYVIPSSSLEKSLLTGDYLFVSKVSYGPRIPQTPLTMPLTQHSLPTMFGVTPKSYIEWPHWEYRRVSGLGKVELNDIVVFNYPAGDTICTEMPFQTEYYNLCYTYGQGLVGVPELDSLSAMERRNYYDYVYAMGRHFVADPSFRKAVCDSKGWDYQEFGEIASRPTDRRENYVKRCVGLPGQTLQIIDRKIYLDGKENKTPEQAQFTYFVRLNNISVYDLLSERMDDLRKELRITREDISQLGAQGFMPLTADAARQLVSRGIATETKVVCDSDLVGISDVYPINGNTHWTRDNYGPIWIPKKGEKIQLSLDNLPIYERPIKVYENNQLEVRDGRIFINGKETNEYTFKMDYYWMMGDNRHNSADSRYWGFVPEDHIVGKPIFIWWSSDPDRHGLSGIRWSRLFNFVDNIK